MITNWPSWLNLTPPPTNQYEYASIRREHYYRRERRLERGHHTSHTYPSSTAESPPPSAVESPPAPAEAVSNPPASLTLAGDSGDRDRARRLLASVDSRLVQVNSHKLQGADIEAYHRANQLALRAHRALDDHDYAAASSLAAKASSLANGIGTSGF